MTNRQLTWNSDVRDAEGDDAIGSVAADAAGGGFALVVATFERCRNAASGCSPGLGRCRTTRENAHRAAEAINRHGFENVVLVAHARHRKRGELCFRKLGIQVVPAPCRASSTCLLQTFGRTWVPTVDGLSNSTWVALEWVALLYYRLHGWI
jgi:hypothetical protein